MDVKEMGSFIATQRKASNMTQAELAEKLHVTDKAVSKWERGIGFPDINTLEPLADALGISITELMRCELIDIADLDAQGEMRTSSDEDKKAAELLNDTLDIVKWQKKYERKRRMIAVWMSVAGIALFIAGVIARVEKYRWNTSISMIGGADGPTSVFIAGRIGPDLSVILLGVGILLILISMIKLLRSK